MEPQIEKRAASPTNRVRKGQRLRGVSHIKKPLDAFELQRMQTRMLLMAEEQALTAPDEKDAQAWARLFATLAQGYWRAIELTEIADRIQRLETLVPNHGNHYA
jgi:hypothetical protein